MYWYEHIDGTVHQKPDIVVDMAGGPRVYFEGPLVKRWWWEPDEIRIWEAGEAE